MDSRPELIGLSAQGDIRVDLTIVGGRIAYQRKK
jgi:hypothetical protein